MRDAVGDFMKPIYCLILIAVGLLPIVLLGSAAAAEDQQERSRVGHNITIGPDEEVSEASCFVCSIRVRGRVAGDVSTFLGKIIVEDGGEIGGDAAVFGGEMRLGKEAHVGGDVAVFGGRIYRDPSSSVGGDVANTGGRGFVVMILLAPFVFLALIIVLITWLIRRIRRPSQPAPA